ncbi:hypothetical protein AYO38_11680 [bacterium SCGC AG-212-C10]|nr:hypothetical protein AYO38_11680 [bacterium SCGC AG-212-C10]
MDRKRANGEGTIFKRSNGRYVAAAYVPDGKGGTKRKFLYGKDHAEVQQKLLKLRSAAQMGIPASDDRTTLSTFLAEWLEDTVKPTVKGSTYAGYSSLVRVHISPKLGKVALGKLTPQMVERFQNERLSAGCSPRNVQYMRAVLRVALGKAVAWGLVGRNVADLVKSPAVRRYEIHPLSAEQVRTFLEGVRGDRLEALYVAAFTTGLRQGELLGLTWQDLNLESGTLTVRQALTRQKGEGRFDTPKSERSRRTITIPAMTTAAFELHLQTIREEKKAIGLDWVPVGLVFTTGTGEPLDGHNVRHYFQRHLSRLKLPHQRFHDTRHACATFLLSQGVPARVVSEMLGHSQVSLTLDTYSHVVTSLMKDAAARMDQLLSPSSPSTAGTVEIEAG